MRSGCPQASVSWDGPSIGKRRVTGLRLVVRDGMVPVRDVWLLVQKGPTEEKRKDFYF